MKEIQGHHSLTIKRGPRSKVTHLKDLQPMFGSMKVTSKNKFHSQRTRYQ